MLGNDIKRYHGESFLLQENSYELFFISDNKGVYKAVENSISNNFLIKHENRVTSWLYWIDGNKNIIEQSARLDK